MAGGVRSVANTLPVVKNFLVQRQPSSTYSLSLGGTTYVFTGTAATLAVGIAPASGSYSFTGTGAALGIGIAPSSGSYIFTGTGASLDVGITATPGVYSFTGTGPSLGVGIVPASGSYSFTGTSAGLNIGHTLTSASGAYSIIGSAAALATVIAVTGPTLVHFFRAKFGDYITEDLTALYCTSDSTDANTTYYSQES